MMPLICDIVEIGKFFWQLWLILTLLEDILFLIPTPRLVYLSIVFNNKSTCFDTFRSFAEYTQSLGMNSKVSLYVSFEHLNTWEYYLSYFFVKFCKSLNFGIINDKSKSNSYIVASLTLLLNRKYKLVFNEITLQLRGYILRKKIN